MSRNGIYYWFSRLETFWTPVTGDPVHDTAQTVVLHLHLTGAERALDSDERHRGDAALRLRDEQPEPDDQ